jgi:hypothetical protein
MPEVIYDCCNSCNLLSECNPNYNGTPACFQKALESQTTVVQQLKAEGEHMKKESILKLEKLRSIYEKLFMESIEEYGHYQEIDNKIMMSEAKAKSAAFSLSLSMLEQTLSEIKDAPTEQ